MLLVCAPAARIAAAPLDRSALESRLAQQTSVVWSGRTLREGLMSLAGQHEVAVWLDRRVDPGQEVALEAEGPLLDGVLLKVAQTCGLGLTRVGPVVYLGPAETARRLRTWEALRRQEAQSLPAELRRKIFLARPQHWSDLTTPRELLQSAVAPAGLRIENLADLPHDLWPGNQLPPVDLVEFLTLLLAGFDRTFHIDPQTGVVRLVPAPADAVLEHRYPAGPAAAARAKAWQQRFPEAVIRVEGDRIVVAALLEVHEELRGTRRPMPPPMPDAPELERQRFTLEVRDQPLEGLLQALAGRIGLELVIDRAALRQAGIALDRRVSFKVTSATVDELLEAVLKPAGLTFRRQQRRVTILAATAEQP